MSDSAFDCFQPGIIYCFFIDTQEYVLTRDEYGELVRQVHDIALYYFVLVFRRPK